MNFSRRSFLLTSSLSAASAYAYQRGLRYPRLSFETGRPIELINSSWGQFKLRNAIATEVTDELHLRAITPEPVIRIDAKRGNFDFTIGNIANNAKLDIKGIEIKLVDEEISGIQRKIYIKCNRAQTIELSWKLDVNDGFEFATLGDTGGGDELKWALRKAGELGVQFLLHLGDFNYGDTRNGITEYDQAISHFTQSPVPVYVSIGNHDFNDNGIVCQHFLNKLGPMNYAFSLADTRFINIDTAADFLPVSGGKRGQLIQALHNDQQRYSDSVFFSHRPLRDPRPGRNHVAGQSNEVRWLAHSINLLNSNTLLTGHVHHSAELDYNGIRQWTVGEGLGHEDILLQQQVAQLLIGKVQPGKEVSYRWQNLDMPWQYHTSATHEKKLLLSGRLDRLEWYKKLI